jgi:hypothetical protein
VGWVYRFPDLVLKTSSSTFSGDFEGWEEGNLLFDGSGEEEESEKIREHYPECSNFRSIPYPNLLKPSHIDPWLWPCFP